MNPLRLIKRIPRLLALSARRTERASDRANFPVLMERCHHATREYWRLGRILEEQRRDERGRALEMSLQRMNRKADETIAMLEKRLRELRGY